MRTPPLFRFAIVSAVVLAVAVLPALAGAGTILNTLQGYDADTPGWSGGLDGLYTGSGGNTERILLTVSGRMQWQRDVDRIRLQVSGGYEESKRDVTARNFVAHLRHNHDLGPRWATILFSQVQANPFQRLESRWLFGAGLRRDLAESDRGTVAVGATPMLEIERLEHQDGHLTRGRMSVFVHASHDVGDDSRLDLVAFWQPLFSDLGAARTSATLTLTVDVTGSVDVKTGAAVEDNAHAPAGVERTDWSTFAGFGVSF